MRVRRLDHVAFAVADLDAAIALWERALGLRCAHRERVDEQQVEAAFLPVGDATFELIAPTPGNAGVAGFLQKRGPGLHHVCVEVDDLEGALGDLRAGGVSLIDECPRRGARSHLVAFAHPGSLGGVLLELLQCSGR